MNKNYLLYIILIFITGCSFNKNSKFWGNTEKVENKEIVNFEEVFPKERSLQKEFNSGLKISLNKKRFRTDRNENYNNNDVFNFIGTLEKSSRFNLEKKLLFQISKKIKPDITICT